METCFREKQINHFAFHAQIERSKIEVTMGPMGTNSILNSINLTPRDKF